MTTYEAGTVAAIQTSVIADDGGVAVRVKRCTLTDEPVWMWLTNGGVPRADGGFVRDENVTDVRPLVVLDLPNGALAGWPVVVNALRAARRDTGYHMIFDGLVDQIEVQARPPKPSEPTGLGAVVETADGRR